MAEENAPLISDELSGNLLGLKRRRMSDLGNVFMNAPAAASAAWHRDPGGAAGVYARANPQRMSAQEFETMKIQLKMRIMKQMQEYENSQLSGIEGIIKAVNHTDKAGAEIFKSLLRANGLTDEAGSLGSGGSSVDKSLASAKATMHGSMLEFAQNMVKDTDANAAGVDRIMEQVFQTALATPGMWLGAGGPLENLARFVQSNISAGDASTAYGGITAVAAMMAMQGKDLKAILESNADKPIFKFLYEQLDDAGRWSDRFQVKARLIGTMVGYTSRAMEQVAGDVAKAEAERTGSPDATPDINKRIDDVLEQSKKVMEGLGMDADPKGQFDVLGTETLIDKIRGPGATVDRATAQQYLEMVDKWKGNLETSALRAQILSSPDFQAFKAKLGLQNDDVALKEAMRQNGELLHKERMADRATIRSWRSADKAASITEKPGSAPKLGKQASAGMVSQQPRLGQSAPVAGTPAAPPDGLIEPGNIDLNNRPVVPNGSDYSTVLSMSFGEDGVEILVPMVSDDGRLMTKDEAVEEYHRTRKHLGKFASPAEATTYAEKLHKEQEAQYAPQPEAQTVDSDKPPEFIRGPDGGIWVLSYTAKTFEQITEEEMNDIAAQVGVEAESLVQDMDKFEEAKQRFLDFKRSTGSAPATQSAPSGSSLEPLGGADNLLPSRYARGADPVDAPDATDDVPAARKDTWDPEFKARREIATPNSEMVAPISSGAVIPGALTPAPFPSRTPMQRSLDAIQEGNVFAAGALPPARVKKRRNPFLDVEELYGVGEHLPR